MKEYIDKQEVDQLIYDYAESNNLSYTNMKNYILDIPAADVAPVVHAKWIYKELGVRTYGIVCSNCERILHEGQNFNSLRDFIKAINERLEQPNISMDKYCSECGAKMDGE